MHTDKYRRRWGKISTNIEVAVENPEELIERLRNGESELRDRLINTYWNFILITASKLIGKNADSTDEFSIALEAFNEAIDSFDCSKNKSFINFAGLVINRRVIDHFRKKRRFDSEYPFSYFVTEENADMTEMLSADTPAPIAEKYEIQEEIMEFKSALSDFGISIEALVNIAPKHTDTRALCAEIASMLAKNEELAKKMYSEKKLPIASILGSFGLSRKTIEKNRKYIVALFIIMRSDMEIIKGYINSYRKGTGVQ